MTPSYRPVTVGHCLSQASVEYLADGGFVLRSTEPLAPYPKHLGERLAHWGQIAPDRTLAAQRGVDGAWQAISYAEMIERAKALGQALLNWGLNVERPLVILSDNDLDHLSLMLGAMWAGIPSVSVSPAYSLVSTDFGRLRHILSKTTPGAVYAASSSYAAAINATVAADTRVILGEGQLISRTTERFADMLTTLPGPQLDEAHSKVGPDTIVKLMFTSGSTKDPKGVIITQRMWCANQQMTLQAMPFLVEQPPVALDWLPWNHTFGGNHNLGIVLFNGGSLYIDEGKPAPGRFAQTLRNLQEIAPTIFFNVPKGFDELVSALQVDIALRDHFFSRLKLVECGGAGLSQKTLDAFNHLAESAIGERIRLAAGLGMTETAPTCTFAIPDEARAGFIGWPVPGVDVKLVPVGGKAEVRFRGPNVMPGYWREPELTQEAFDEEGYYRTGDAACPAVPDDPTRGLMFDGRIAEDFKLSTGTFVSVGPLRARVIALGFPCVHDAVVTGFGRDEVGLLIVPRMGEIRRLAELPDDAPTAIVLGHTAVRGFFQTLAKQLWDQGTGSASRPARLMVLAKPPSIDGGEITDKGSINQRAMLSHRAALVELLHDAPVGHPDVIFPLDE
ncbi:feruloyl-CoA synthase [Roseateles koreensis]|uniref:Feruloyl-CoA synthase n=1 Tax=Roseateles koreensis TaxID=2987526 RepID=A0ABT5KNG5_9BURK|nr:feruloyl-CoA synthase [Roseateles koreensis]MDC8784392.1 feruloyl-CoA synthase [Roseateles koreensis]